MCLDEPEQRRVERGRVVAHLLEGEDAGRKDRLLRGDGQATGGTIDMQDVRASSDLPRVEDQPVCMQRADMPQPDDGADLA